MHEYPQEASRNGLSCWDEASVAEKTMIKIMILRRKTKTMRKNHSLRSVQMHKSIQSTSTLLKSIRICIFRREGLKLVKPLVKLAFPRIVTH